MPPLGTGQPATVRFWRFVDQGGSDECWLWTGAVVAGYGVLAGDERRESGVRRMVKAHRLSWSIANERAVPEGMVVCHTCDVPRCVNPRHLFVGSHTDNRQDQINKGRSPHQQRTWKPRALLTAGQVEQIRPLRGVLPAAAVASEYGVGAQAIYDIWQGRTWAN